jgi:hypothetical protein
MSSKMPQFLSISYKCPLPHCNKGHSNVSSNVNHFASSAETGMLHYSPLAKLPENMVRLIGRATSYPARPSYNSMHVLRGGIQLEELYVNSVIAARHYMHVQLYGQMSFLFTRVDLFEHNIVLQSATQNASILSLMFGFFPILQMLYIILRAYLISNTAFCTRHSRKSTRASLRRHYSSCTRLAYRTLSFISVLYLCMFSMYIDPSSGRRCILTVTYTSQSNTRRRKATYSIPTGMKRLARQCDKAFLLISSTYTTYQTSQDNSSMLACWMWTAVYSNTDPLPYTHICIPPAETFAVALLIMYFLSPIVPTIYKILLQSAILPRYNFVLVYAHTTLHLYWLCIQLLPHQLFSRMSLTISRAHTVSIPCYHHLSTWVSSITAIFCTVAFSCSPLLIALLLIMAGDVEANPGPMEGPSIASLTSPISIDLPPSGPITREHLHIMNWNCRGIDGKLAGLLQFLQTLDIHVAILTETRRSIGTHKSSQDFQSGGYTFYFSSHIDTSHSTSFINSRARE